MPEPPGRHAADPPHAPRKREYRLLVLGERSAIKLVDAFHAEDDKEAWERTRHWTAAGYKFELWCGLQQIKAGSDGSID